MKTTTVRKLLPEAWGFVCPVHTPDGTPCGLLNHITLSCAPIPSEENSIQEHLPQFKQLLTRLGMQPTQTDFNVIQPINFLPVLLDGVLLGYVDPKFANDFSNSLREIKIRQDTTDELLRSVPQTLEIAYLPPGSTTGQSTAARAEDASEVPREKNYYFPGIFLSSQVSRFVRPVQNLIVGGVEWIGPLEQIALSIATLEEDIRPDTTH